MGLKFSKSSAKPAGGSTADKPQNSSKSSGGGGFLKKGAAAKAAMQDEEAKAELRKQEQGKMWRFWVPPGEDRQITFLDGDLDDDGMLDIPMYYEHQVRVNGAWETFVCTADDDQTQPCPICEKGDSQRQLVGVMTVIDHSDYKIKKGANAGKTITNQRKLFVAKQATLKLLTKLAVKRGGLARCTFDVSRSGDKAANVGDAFDFVQKWENLQEIADACEIKIEEAQPADYEAEITYRTPEELIELGVGKAHGGVGYEKGVSGLSDQL